MEAAIAVEGSCLMAGGELIRRPDGSVERLLSYGDLVKELGCWDRQGEMDTIIHLMWGVLVLALIIVALMAAGLWGFWRATGA